MLFGMQHAHTLFTTADYCLRVKGLAMQELRLCRTTVVILTKKAVQTYSKKWVLAHDFQLSTMFNQYTKGPDFCTVFPSDWLS